MKQNKCQIIKNEPIAKDIYELILKADTSEITKPGQFLNIAIEGFYLRRPISICNWAKDKIYLVYKVVGKGTQKLSQMKDGYLDILYPLGNGFDIEKIPDRPILVGGGVGIPPIYALAKTIINKNPRIYLGFKDSEEVFYIENFKKLGLEVEIKIGGYISELIDKGQYICACGPEAMLQALDLLALDGQYSFEERMACGFGACMGCSCKTKYGNKRICKDGPVLFKEEIIW